jgi:hypothetical protein
MSRETLDRLLFLVSTIEGLVVEQTLFVGRASGVPGLIALMMTGCGESKSTPASPDAGTPPVCVVVDRDELGGSTAMITRERDGGVIGQLDAGLFPSKFAVDPNPEVRGVVLVNVTERVNGPARRERIRTFFTGKGLPRRNELAWELPNGSALQPNDIRRAVCPELCSDPAEYILIYYYGDYALKKLEFQGEKNCVTDGGVQ